jgi:hypothetical protein
MAQTLGDSERQPNSRTKHDLGIVLLLCVGMHASLFVRVGKSFGRLPVFPEENNGS